MRYPRWRFLIRDQRIGVAKPGMRTGVRLGALIDLGFFVCIEHTDTGDLTYGDTLSMVRQALTVYDRRLPTLPPQRRASYERLRQAYEAMYGPWQQPRDKGTHHVH